MLSRKVKILAISLFLMGILVSLTGLCIASSIVRYSSDWPPSIDPAVGSEVESVTAQVNLFDPLIFPDTEGNFLPHVAKSWMYHLMDWFIPSICVRGLNFIMEVN